MLVVLALKNSPTNFPIPKLFTIGLWNEPVIVAVNQIAFDYVGNLYALWVAGSGLLNYCPVNQSQSIGWL